MATPRQPPVEALVAELHAAAREATALAEAVAAGDTAGAAKLEKTLRQRLDRLDDALAPLAQRGAPASQPEAADAGEAAAALRLHLDATARYLADAQDRQAPEPAETAVAGLRRLAQTLLACRAGDA